MDNTLLKKIESNFKSGGFHASKIWNPHKHWKVLLWAFSVVASILVIFSLYLLYQIKNEQIFQVRPTLGENSTLLKEKLIKSVSEVFDQKASKENALKANPPSYQDPSI
jgi:hypothetical protein